MLNATGTTDLLSAKNSLYTGALIGNYIPVAGFVFDYKGARFCAGAGILFTTAGYLLVWAAVADYIKLEYWQLVFSTCARAGCYSRIAPSLELARLRVV